MKIILTITITLISFSIQAQQTKTNNKYNAKVKYIIDGNPIQYIHYKYENLIDQSYCHTEMKTQPELLHMPIYEIHDMVAMFPHVYQKRRGDEVQISGARPEGTLYIIDGVQMMRSK